MQGVGLKGIGYSKALATLATKALAILATLASKEMAILATQMLYACIQPTVVGLLSEKGKCKNAISLEMVFLTWGVVNETLDPDTPSLLPGLKCLKKNLKFESRKSEFTLKCNTSQREKKTCDLHLTWIRCFV